MSITTAQGNLVILGANTNAAQVFFNGTEVLGITEISLSWEKKEQRVRLKVNGKDDALYMELIDAGITVKKEKGGSK